MAQLHGSELNPRIHFERIDILRGVAAIMVMLYHVIVIGNFTTFPSWGPFQILRNGWMGVNLFFVISGFVITLSLSREKIAKPNKARLNFMTRRWFRIAPLYYFTIFIFIAFLQPHLLFLSAKSMAAHFGTHALFLHNLHPQTTGSIVGPNWTVALEMQFYLLMSFLITILFTWNRFKLLLIFVLSAWIWRYSTTLYLEPGKSVVNDQSILSNMLPGTLDQFFVGILLALLWLSSRETESKLSKRFERSALNCLLYMCLFSVSFAFNLYLLSHTNYWSNTLMIVFYKTMLAFSFGLLVLAFMTIPNKRFVIDLPLQYLGRISYGIYLWHIIVLVTIMERMPWLIGYKLMFIVSAISISLASMSYHLIEKPMIEKGSLIVRSRRNKESD
jgi:peptidoglycan/LPS O-acetylase OafA/YrhL